MSGKTPYFLFFCYMRTEILLQGIFSVLGGILSEIQTEVATILARGSSPIILVFLQRNEEFLLRQRFDSVHHQLMTESGRTFISTSHFYIPSTKR